MALNFNEPNNDSEIVSTLPSIRDNVAGIAKQFKGVSAINIPVDSVRFENGVHSRWNGVSWITELPPVSGGGTGANTAAGARANIGADDAGNLTKGILNASRLSGTYTINITGNATSSDSAGSAGDSALLNGHAGSFYQNAGNMNAGILPVGRLVGSYNISISGGAATANNASLLDGNNAAFYRNASNLNAGTVPAARLPLNDTVTSTSTAQAATANAVKTAYDKGVDGLNRASTQVGSGSISGVYYNEYSATDSIDGNAYTLKVVRVGDMVTVSLSQIVTSPRKSMILQSAAPSWARPQTYKDNVYAAIGSSVESQLVRRMRMGDNGLITISCASELSSWGSPSISYVVGV